MPSHIKLHLHHSNWKHAQQRGFFFSSAYSAGGAAAWQTGDVIFGSDGGGGGGGCINFLLPTEEKSKGVISTGVTRSYARRRTGE